MSDEFREQIYNELNLRETEDLLEIWQTNDHDEWSETAFDVIKEILSERLGEIPPQNSSEGEPEEIFEDDDLDEWEAKALDDESQPEFYSTLDVINLKSNINKVAKAVVVVFALLNLIAMQNYVSIVGSYFVGRDLSFTPLVYFIAFVLTCLNAAVGIALVYFPLQALAHILRILMEMEFRSRKAS